MCLSLCLAASSAVLMHAYEGQYMEDLSRETNVELDKTCKCALATGKEWLPDFPQWHLIKAPLRWVTLWASPF